MRLCSVDIVILDYYGRCDLVFVAFLFVGKDCINSYMNSFHTSYVMATSILSFGGNK